ncbi:putative sulfate exporter family transporter, partial [Salmonella enterica subsp. enterica serovar Anatum]|nr:putative sulfate exporter family transporter [Salmonella enterica subsp. enterica serovar Anatum]
QIWKQCDGGVLFAKQHLLRLGIILYGFRLTFSQIADVGISGIQTMSGYVYNLGNELTSMQGLVDIVRLSPLGTETFAMLDAF